MTRRLAAPALCAAAFLSSFEAGAQQPAQPYPTPPAQPYPPQPAQPYSTPTPQPPYPAQPQQPPAPSAGGLTAPGPVPEEQQGAPSETEERLDESKEEDSGRGLTWFWFNVEGGFEHVGLETFDVDESNLTAGFVASEASGGFVGAGLGLQLFVIRLGPRGRIGFFPDWQLFTIGGEVGAQFPLGIFEPFINLGAGYATLGNMSDVLQPLADQANVSGFYARIGGGLDVYIGNVFSLGVLASWELLGLTRPGVDLASLGETPASLNEAQEKALAAEGSGYGSAVHVGGRVGLSF